MTSTDSDVEIDPETYDRWMRIPRFMYDLIERHALPLSRDLIDETQKEYMYLKKRHMIYSREVSCISLVSPQKWLARLSQPWAFFQFQVKKMWEEQQGLRATYFRVVAAEVIEVVKHALQKHEDLRETRGHIIASRSPYIHLTSQQTAFMPFQPFPCQDRYEQSLLALFVGAVLCHWKNPPQQKGPSNLTLQLQKIADDFVAKSLLPEESIIRNDLKCLVDECRNDFNFHIFPLFATDWMFDGNKALAKWRLLMSTATDMQYVLAHPLAAIDSKWTPKLSLAGTERMKGLPTSIAVRVLEFAESELFPLQCLPRAQMRSLISRNGLHKYLFKTRPKDRFCIRWLLQLVQAEEEISIRKAVNTSFIVVSKTLKRDAETLQRIPPEKKLPKHCQCDEWDESLCDECMEVRLKSQLDLREEVQACRDAAKVEADKAWAEDKKARQERKRAKEEAKRKKEEDKKAKLLAKAKRKEARQAKLREKAEQTEERKVQKLLAKERKEEARKAKLRAKAEKIEKRKVQKSQKEAQTQERAKHKVRDRKHASSSPPSALAKKRLMTNEKPASSRRKRS